MSTDTNYHNIIRSEMSMQHTSTQDFSCSWYAKYSALVDSKNN
jgi:hypothetical protein